MDHMEIYNRIYGMAIKSCADTQYKDDLNNQPAETLKKEGFYVPDECDVQVSYDEEQTMHVVIPKEEDIAVLKKLDERSLNSVAAGSGNMLSSWSEPFSWIPAAVGNTAGAEK